jgi:phytoene dehydrogenase-like protein
MAEEYDAVVVGSGPNGLAGAIGLARAGCSVLVLEANSTIGGGARSAELTLPGFMHDVCSAVHPLAAGSPFFKSLPLEQFGLEWIHPEIPLAHPLDNGSTACLYRDVDLTAERLPRDASAYRRLLKPFVRNWEKLANEFLQPMLHLPRHPFVLARFGIPATSPAGYLAKSVFKGEPARALLAGIPRGGSQMISNELANYLRSLGGKIETNRPIHSLADLPNARAILFDVSIWEFVRIAGSRLPSPYRRRLGNFRHAPGVFKSDYALSAPVPWQSAECKRAGTIHLGGTLDEIAMAERDVARGKVPERPFVLIAQQSLFDPTRAPAGKHTLWAYAHVPFGCEIDMTERIEAQIERFAPGFRDCILARQTMNAVDLGKSNRNLAGGDINGGAANLWQLIARPVLSPTPYRTPLPGIYLCSASTPPGGGVHGMCGYHAARCVLHDLQRLSF